MTIRRLGILLLPIALGGCIAQTAVALVTLPVKVAGAAVDAVTTSQDEADRNRGRAIRKQEAREQKERRKAEQEQEREARDATGGKR